VNRSNTRLQPAGEPTAYTHRGDLLELVQAACYAEIQQMWSTKSAQNGRLSLVRYATSLGARDIHRALGAEGLEIKAKLAVEHGHAGGIYMLRLEAAARAAKETARFIPITLAVKAT
jgi:hypothetical protein